MILSTPLERLLVAERERRKADLTTLAGFALPAMGERPLEPSSEPLLVSDMRGHFVEGRVSPARHVARFAFFECPHEEEDRVLASLVSALLAQEWGIRGTMGDVLKRMKSRGAQPYHIVVPYTSLDSVGVPSASKEDVDGLLSQNGHLGLFQEMRVLAANLPEGIEALVTAAPPLLGYYTRADTMLSLTITGADSTIAVVK